MNLKRLILIFSLFVPMFLSALTPDEVMQSAARRIGSAKQLTARFNATYSEGGTMIGTLTIARNRFSMVGANFGVWFNGEDMWSYSEQTGETNLTTPTQAELLETNPIEIINHYADNYTAARLGQSGSVYTVQLTSRRPETGIVTAVIAINTSTWLPTSIKAIFTNGAQMDINITSVTEGDTVPPASAFAYPASRYPGVEVIDLR